MVGGEHPKSPDFSNTFNEELKSVSGEEEITDSGSRPVGFGTSDKDKPSKARRKGWGE